MAGHSTQTERDLSPKKRVEWAGFAFIVHSELPERFLPMKSDDLTCLETLKPPPPVNGNAFVYILACSDAALYIGSTGDLRGRLGQHGGSKAAMFTRDHAGGRLVYYEGPFEFAVR
jgi:hypothetical protein